MHPTTTALEDRIEIDILAHPGADTPEREKKEEEKVFPLAHLIRRIPSPPPVRGLIRLMNSNIKEGYASILTLLEWNH